MALAPSPAAGRGEPTHELIDERGQRLPLVGERLVAGRSAECDIRLSDELASRRHFLLQRTPAGWQIEDLQSTNGTFLNGRRLPAGVSIPVALSDRITVGRTTLVMERSAVSREPSLSGQGPGGYPSGESENRAAEHAVREGHNAGVAKSPIRNSEQPPRVQVTGSAIPAWQWIVSIFIVGAILMLTYGAFQPWVRIQVRLAFEGMVGGELLTDALSLVNGVLQDVFKKPPLVTANAVEISGMSSYGWLTLLAACVAGLVAVLDLALRLKRSVLPGIVYVAVALLPGVVLAADLQRITTLGTVPILLGVNLLDIFQGATKILEPKVVPLTGLYLTVIGLALLTVAGILRAILPALSQGRKPTPLRA